MQDKKESDLPSETVLSEDGFQKFYDEEKEKWKTSMVEALGDLHLYNFNVLYGHPDYHLDDDFLAQQKMKTAPFEVLNEMNSVDKEAEKNFQEILSKIDVNKEIALQEFMQERRKECTDVLEQFDKIVAMSEKYFELEYAHCKKRAEEHLAVQKPMIGEVDKYLSGVEEAGNREIQALKDNIANYVMELGVSWSNKIEEIYEEMNDDLPMMEAWSKCTEVITSKDIRCGFLKLQRETGLLWKKAFDDLLMLSAELEKYRYSYNQTKSELERAIYWMNRNYRDNMPKLTKTQRKINFLAERKTILSKELQKIEKEIEMEKIRKQAVLQGYKDNVTRREASNNLASKEAYVRHRQVFETKKAEVLGLLKSIVNGDQFIHEEILGMLWEPIDTDSLESESLTKDNNLSLNTTEIPHPVIYEDKLSDALKLFMSDGGFQKLLSRIADQLGFMLNFKWVDYVLITLQLENEIRWLELFNVFKIDFVDDFKDFKEHMSKFAKMKGNKKVFDINGAVDGLLQFASMKREQSKNAGSQLSATEAMLDVHEHFWVAVEDKIPKSLLWDNVTELLRKYREALNSRKTLLTKRSTMGKENEDLEKFLLSYYAYYQSPKLE